MVQVEKRDEEYIIPTGTGDTGTANVEGGYLMATTETTYEVWYEVAHLGGSHGLSLWDNKGREGNDGTDVGGTDSEQTEPVTTVSWRDIVACG